MVIFAIFLLASKKWWLCKRVEGKRNHLWLSSRASSNRTHHTWMHLACFPLDFMLSTVWEHLQEKSIAGDVIQNVVLKVSMFAREGSCRWHITRFSYCKCRLAQLVGSPHKLIWSQKNPQRLFQSKASPPEMGVELPLPCIALHCTDAHPIKWYN